MGGKVINSVIVTADLHLRTKPYPEDLDIGVQLLNDLKKAADSCDTNIIIIAGDLIHSKYKPSMELLLRLYDVLEEMKEEGYKVIWLRGNHETPWKSDPENSLVNIYRNVAYVINSPKNFKFGNTKIWFLPWYPIDIYKEKLREITESALLYYDGPRILISHIGLKEGMVSPSNYKIEQPIGVKDFPSDLFDYILLGDYHIYQRLGKRKNIIYLGAPIPLQYGDESIESVWELSVTGEIKLSRIGLTGQYPDYQTWEIPTLEDIHLHNYSEYNHNRIITTPELAGKVKAAYSDAEIIYMHESEIKSKPTRLKEIENPRGNYLTIFEEFCKIKKWNNKYKKLGKEFLEVAAREFA